MSREQVTMIKKYIDNMMSKNFIRRNHFDYAFSMLIMKKSNEDFRVCVNYRFLNALIIKNKNVSSLIKDTLTRLCFAKIYIKFDIIVVFNEIKVRENDQDKIVFIIRYELFEYVVMFFELCNVLEIFQFFINEIFREYLDDFCIIYLNDILIYNNNFEKHQKHVHKILDKLRKEHIYLNIKKCQFNVIKVKYLELIIIIEDIKMNFEKVKIIQKWEISRCIRDVQVFLNFANFYRRFILVYSRLFKSLIALIKLNKKNLMFLWVFDDLKDDVFRKLKKVFTSNNLLRHFDWTKKIWIKIDAFDYIIVVVLFQMNENDVLRLVIYMFKQMSLVECNYEIYDKELLAIVRAFEKWHSKCVEISMKELIKIINDHRNLEIFMSIKSLNRRQACWIEFLLKFNFRILYRLEAQKVKSNNLIKRSQNLSKSNVDIRRQFQ